MSSRYKTLSEKIALFKQTMTRPDGVRCFTEAEIDRLIEMRFFSAPASTKSHNAYEGGLFDHSRRVTELLVDLTAKNNLVWQDPDSPYIVGMYHDLCKCDQYRKLDEPDEHGRMYKFFPYTPVEGHGDKSVILCSTFTSLTEEEMMCILYHMGASADKSTWGRFNSAIKKFPNVLWTHVADTIAAQIEEC